MRTIKIVAFLALAGFVALTGYAYFGDMSPPSAALVIPLGGANGG